MRVVATFCWTCEKIESVQHRFSKRFTCCSDLRYCKRLAIPLDLTGSNYVVCVLILYMCIKYFLVWLKQMHQFFFRVHVTRGHSLKLFVPQSRLDVRKYFFCHRVVHCWNSLPAQPDDFSSLNKFKRLLERAGLTIFISCTD